MPLLRGVALAALLSTAGCARACKNDHPYVPYSVDDAQADASAEGGAAAELAPISGDAGARASTAEPALVAPPGATRWNIEGLELVAPPERELLMAIVRDVDGDGRKDALALVRPPASPGKPNEVGPAEIIFYSGASSPPRPAIVAAAPQPRVDASCTPVARLERIGPRSALAEVGTSCTRGASTRALFVVRLAKDPGIAFDLAVADPPGAPKLAIDVDGEDRDHDGVDDVTLRVTIEGGGPPFEPGPKLSAKVAFFDRSAGPSRDPDEPDASMKAIASQVAARAGKPKDAPTVPVIVQQMRMLYRAMCLEGGAPRLLKLAGVANGSTTGAVSCGSSKPLEDAGIAELRSFVTQQDALRAVAAASTAQLAPATKTAARTTEIAKLLGDVAPFVQAKSSRVVAITLTTARSPHPEWGSLAFEPSGSLLVRGPAGLEHRVLRVDAETGTSVDGELPAWPTQVLSPDGKSRWLEAYHACEGVALRATFAPTGGDSEMRDVLLPVAPPLGSRCAGGRGEAATTIPIAWGPRGLEALVAGQPLLVRPEASSATVMASPLGEMPPFGSPRSPGGRATAIATSQGVLVKTTKAARYKAPDFEPYGELTQCTTNDDATHVACVRRGRVVVGTFDPL
ncbi:MAG: hypothetical protein JWP87_867 [Labilithrix sp.]|nr:hypothetical protein [Labilithrix sp.]